MNQYKSRSFVLTLLGLTILAVMAYRGVDTSGAIVALIGMYIGAKQSLKASSVWAASKDPAADTTQVIKELSK
jgi:hypothetical protein